MTGKTQRRLAAIIAADVAGYSRLMHVDEEATMAAWWSYRKEVIDPMVTEHGGRVVKLTGDGFLAEFSSATDAVSAAIAMQSEISSRLKNVPEDKRVEFRMGINLGDILWDEEDIYGDGVNIAARIEALADPGGILVSASIYDQVHHRLSAGFEDIGEQNLKNIDVPLRVYRVVEPSENTVVTKINTPTLALPDKPSIAVLPFNNMSGDPEQEYFSDGITEDLITALSKIRWFFVIARNSTFTYKGQAVDVTKVAHELGVRYVLEGSVRKMGSRVRITAQLIDAKNGAHVWAERYDREIEDIFALQDEMTQTIVGAVEPELGAAEREKAVHKPPENLDAWETYQRGLWHLWRFTKDDIAKSRIFLIRARELDTGFASAYAFESYSHYIDVMVGHTDSPDDSIAAGLIAAQKSIKLDEKDAVGYFALGRIQMLRGKHDASVEALEQSLYFNPSFAQAHHGLAFALALSGKLEEAITHFDQAIRLSPLDPIMWAITVTRSMTCTLMNQYEEAIKWAQKTLQNPRTSGYWPYAALASALGNLDRIKEAREAIDKAIEIKPDLSLAYIKRTLPTKHPGGLRPYLEGLRKAGLEN